MSSAGLGNFSVRVKSVFEIYSEDSIGSAVWCDRLGVFLPVFFFGGLRPNFKMLRSSESFWKRVFGSVKGRRESAGESSVGWL